MTATFWTNMERMLGNKLTIITLGLRDIEGDVIVTYLNCIFKKLGILFLRKIVFKIKMRCLATINGLGNLTTLHGNFVKDRSVIMSIIDV